MPTLLMGMPISTATSTVVSLKFRNGTVMLSSNPTTGYIPKKHDLLYLLAHAYSITVHNSQNME